MDKLTRSIIKIENDIVTFVWHPGVILDEIKAESVHGFCFNKSKKVALTRDKDESRFTLPGGGVEKGESPKEALIREFVEEAQFTPTNIEVLGTLEVLRENSEGELVDHHQQVRFICSVENEGGFLPNKNGWETEERIFVDPKDLPLYLEWITYPTGRAIYERFLENLP